MSRPSAASSATPPFPRCGRLLCLACLALLTLAGCGRRDEVVFPAGTPIILISIDTLRSDRLPIYGYDGVETPAIDALRRDSILFERAYSHIPLTLPSHASMLTGQLPTEHQVRDNLGYHLDTAGRAYLPQLLRQRGYATGGFVSAYVLRGTTGIADGFDLFDDEVQVVTGEALGALQRDGADTLEAALDWIDEVREEPFFLFFHIYEPHTPYAPSEPWASRYPDDPYDAEVAESSAIVGRLLERLRELDLYSESLIVLLSDHGEGLGDHGQPGHEVLIYREVVQVPLLVKLPGGRRAGDSVERPVQLIDLLPTIGELASLPLPEGLRGTSLLASEVGERTIYSESYYARLHFGWSEQRSMIAGPYHYISGPDDEIYDLRRDFDESDNLIRRHRRLAADLKQSILDIGSSFEGPSQSDPEVASRLAALGYLGGTVTTDDGAPLDDPRDKKEVLRDITEGLELMSRREFARAVEVFERVVASEPQVVDAWAHLGKARRRVGRGDGALAAYREALRLSGGAPQVALSAAELHLDRGELEEARHHAELAAESHPVAHDVLAQIALAEDDLERAAAHVEDSLRRRGTRVGPLITQAELVRRQGDLDRALGLTMQAEEEFGERTDREVLRGLYFTRGSVLARQGKGEEAVKAFLQEIEISPDAARAYSHLAVLYALLGQGEKVGPTLRRMAEASPTAATHAEAVRVLLHLGDDRSARRLLTYALGRWPDDGELETLRDEMTGGSSGL